LPNGTDGKPNLFRSSLFRPQHLLGSRRFKHDDSSLHA
jgi:hypothetical protein